MSEARAKGLWWRKKRWVAAAGLVWLVAMYPLAPAPLAYVYGRGWISSGTFDRVDRVFVPLASALSVIPGTINGQPVVGWWRTWNGLWFELGWRQVVEEPDVLGGVRVYPWGSLL